MEKWVTAIRPQNSQPKDIQVHLKSQVITHIKISLIQSYYTLWIFLMSLMPYSVPGACFVSDNVSNGSKGCAFKLTNKPYNANFSFVLERHRGFFFCIFSSHLSTDDWSVVWVKCLQHENGIFEWIFPLALLLFFFSVSLLFLLNIPKCASHHIQDLFLE